MTTLRLSLLIVTFAIDFSQLSFAQDNTSSFVNSFEKLANRASNLTQSYENEYTKWKSHQYDDETMISITNNYLPKYQNLISESKALQPPKRYQNAMDLYTKSLQSEFQSDNHLRNYLPTNNPMENKLAPLTKSSAIHDVMMS